MFPWPPSVMCAIVRFPKGPNGDRRGAKGVGEKIETTGGVSRRDLIKKSVVAGGLVWATPTLLATPAGAEHSCEHCNFLFGIKFTRPGSCGGTAPCSAPGTTASPGNCLASAGHTGFADGCCLLTTTAVSCTVGGVTETHPYVELICYPAETAGCAPTAPCTTSNTAVIDLAPGVVLCDALSKCGQPCVRSFATSPVVKCGQTFTRVTLDCDDPAAAGGLSHLELLVCVTGTVRPCS